MLPAGKSRGYSKWLCNRLCSRHFPVFGLRGKHQVPPEGITVICDHQMGIRLEAHHIMGKEVDFDDEKLHKFLVDLGNRFGIGYLERYEEVEYEYVDIHGDDCPGTHVKGTDGTQPLG